PNPHPPIHLSVCRSNHLFLIPIPSRFTSICFFMPSCTHLSKSSSIHPSILLSVSLCIYPSVHLSMHSSIHPSEGLWVCMYVCEVAVISPSICLSLPERYPWVI